MGWHEEQGWDRLTEREKAVVARVATGMTNREIAKEMYLATATVKAHLSRAMSKLGVTNRTQAALIAPRRQLIFREMTARVSPEAG